MPGHSGNGGRGETTPLTNTNNAHPKDESFNFHSDHSSSNFGRRSFSWKDRTNCILAISASLLALGLCLRVFYTDALNGFRAPGTSGRQEPTGPLFDENGRYIFRNYDAKPTFANFLPGLAGIYGKPLYAFSVNRGQAIASFGIESKDTPIMEFNAANKAYQNTALLGFRTFIKGQRGTAGTAKSFLVEPFSPLRTKFSDHPNNDDDIDTYYNLPDRFLYNGANELQIQEIDKAHHLETNVTYFILPEEDFGAFVRRVKITNTHPKEPLKLDLVDGLAKMEPYGGKLDHLLKNIGRTLEGWMGVYFPHADSTTMPFYRLSTEPDDSASVNVLEQGHYCLSMLEGNSGNANHGGDGKPNRLLPIIYDTERIFGEDTTLLRPVELYTKTVAEIISGPQYGLAKTSSAFAAVEEMTLGPGESLTISTFFGSADKILDVPVIARRILQEGFVQYKFTRTREIIRQITAGVETNTVNKLFDRHVQQMFLDNSLRGGIPVILGDTDDDDRMKNVDEDRRLKVYHVFSRIHGDLERDYNDFVLSSTFFSQGPGNFRDVAQNRRNDVVFNPRVGSFNVRSFLSFIQADAYEPLSVEAVVFNLDDIGVCERIAESAVGRADGHRAQREALSGILNSGSFRPGQLFDLIRVQNIELVISRQDFIDMVASEAESSPMAVYQTGFWADHWTYYLDMIDSFLSIYPDREQQLLYDEKLPYFFSPATVQPRAKKYVESLSYDASHNHVRQLNATMDDKEKQKSVSKYITNISGWYELEASWQRDANETKFTSSPIAKLFLLATLKFATRDAYGMGVEYEGGRPGWDDANNGIVGMLGSGMPETFELKALCQYIYKSSSRYRRPIVVPEELAQLIDEITAALKKLGNYTIEPPLPGGKVPDKLFMYWDSVATAREEYREKVRFSFTGVEVEYQTDTILRLLESWMNQVEFGIQRAIMLGSQGYMDDGTSGITPAYFAYNVTRWRRTGNMTEEGRHPLVYPLEMAVSRFPLFLEGPTRMMKTVDSKEASKIYHKVRNSDLRDQGLSMYTLSASLKGQSPDIGRMMAFAPGWLENQSVWLHMSYKFYLELIRHGLLDEFYDEMKSGGMLPFMDPAVYGRSLMECSSFLASSAFADPSIHGRGFQARLSGSTAEFLSMWVLMFIGSNPFYISETSGELRFALIPSLPLWLFESGDNAKNDLEMGVPTVSFKLFASIDVRYYNENRMDLFLVSPTRYVIGLRDGTIYNVDEPSVPKAIADKIRRVVFVDFIEAYF